MTRVARADLLPRYSAGHQHPAPSHSVCNGRDSFQWFVALSFYCRPVSWVPMTHRCRNRIRIASIALDAATLLFLLEFKFELHTLPFYLCSVHFLLQIFIYIFIFAFFKDALMSLPTQLTNNASQLPFYCSANSLQFYLGTKIVSSPFRSSWSFLVHRWFYQLFSGLNSLQSVWFRRPFQR